MVLAPLPWVSLPDSSPFQPPGFLAKSLAACLNLLRNFNFIVSTEGITDRKRKALDCHRSQMTRLVPDARWRTLPETSGGQFLDCFFQGFEIFRR